MKLVTIDFETYWDKDYSLSKMTPIEYVLDDRYETISCAIKISRPNGSQNPMETMHVPFGHRDIAAMFDAIDVSDALLIGHNMSEFDALIAAWKFGLKPRMWGCTLAMARYIHGRTLRSLSLAKLAEHYGLQAKGSLEATETKGKRLRDFSHEERANMRTYNRKDTEITHDLFRRLVKQMPTNELRLIDTHIRMLVEPRFELDTTLLERAFRAEQRQTTKILQALADIFHDGSVEDMRASCASSAKFKKMLQGIGVAVPMKKSPTTGKDIPALAKTDEGMQELLDHPVEHVRRLAEARLKVRSTLLENRITRMLAATYQGRMPVPLRYYGAMTTGRASGSMKLNMQNLPAVRGKPQLSHMLRYALRAPVGWKVVVADLSGIEMRVNHTLWGVQETINAYKTNPEADIYKTYAATYYNVDPEDVTSEQRTLGKVSQLGLGYGVGPNKFIDVARILGGIEINAVEAKHVVWDWRNRYSQIVNGWYICGKALEVIADGDRIMALDAGGYCVAVPKQGIKLPRRAIRYPDLTNKDGDFRYEGGKKYIYGAKVVENIVQSIAGSVLVDIIQRVERTELGREYPLAHQVHDELIYVVRDEHAQAMLDVVNEEMRRSIEWFPELITWSTGAIAQTYGGAK